MNIARIAPLLLSILLLPACEEIDPSKPLKTEPMGVTLREFPNADVRGTVRDQEGTPLPDVRISLGIGEQARTAVTAGDGSYHLADLAAGAYVVTASREGYVSGRTPVALVGEDLFGVDLVLEAYQVAAGHHAETVEVGESGALAQTRTIRSAFPTGIEEVPSIELRLLEGTVLRDASGQVLRGPVEIRVTPIPGHSLVPPEAGTFGVTDADVEVVPGEHTAVKVNVDLGKGQVAEGVEIEEPNPLLRTGARASFVTSMASFVLEPEGLVLENPDGTPRPQSVVFGEVTVADLLSPGTPVDLADREGNVLAGTVGADGRSIDAELSRLARYDLLMRVDVKVLETTLHPEGATKPAKTARVLIELKDGTTFLFPELDDEQLALFLAKKVSKQLDAASCDPDDGKKESNASTRIEITLVHKGEIVLETFAIINRKVCVKEFIVHGQGKVD